MTIYFYTTGEKYGCFSNFSPGDELIVENSPIDYYWGCGADGSGKNMLGQILMEARQIQRCY